MIYPQQTFSKTSNRLDALLALRGFACLMVVIFHCQPPRHAISYKGYDLSWLTFSHGYVAVWIFFVLSGYLMAKAFYAERYTLDVSGVLNFWRNRALRIFPLYYFALLILTLFVYPDWLKIENWGYLVRVFTFTYDFSVQYQSGLNFNGVFWSLSTEVQFYILVPFIYSYFKPRLFKSKYVVLSAILIFFIMFVTRCVFWITFKDEITNQFAYMFKYWYAPMLTNLDLFLCGFIVNAWLKNQYPAYTAKQINTSFTQAFNIKRLSKQHIAVILIIILYLFTAHHLYHQELWNLTERAGKGFRTSTTIFILPLVTALITSFFIFAFEADEYHSFNKNEKLTFGSILKNPIRIIEVLGNLSYGIYIWHMPILEKMTSIFTSNIPIEAFYIRITVTLILSTLLASITYYLVEIPSATRKIYRQPQK